jgi:hypothetical protein
MQEELASDLANIELNKQKESLADEVDKYKALLAGDLRSLQVAIN